MTFEEYLDRLHKYRAKRAEELADLPPEERFKKANEKGLELAKKLGLTIVKPKQRT